MVENRKISSLHNNSNMINICAEGNRRKYIQICNNIKEISTPENMLQTIKDISNNINDLVENGYIKEDDDYYKILDKNKSIMVNLINENDDKFKVLTFYTHYNNAKDMCELIKGDYRNGK